MAYVAWKKGEIMKYHSGGVCTYLFEVKDIKYDVPPKRLGITEVTQSCYVPEPGSISRYLEPFVNTMEPLIEDGDDFWFPTDTCKNVTGDELKHYEGLNLV